MEAREQRGLAIAATQVLRHEGKAWKVPSQSSQGVTYTVFAGDSKPKCSCPDHTEAGYKCKHIFAVEFTIRRERSSEGIVTETRTLTIAERKTYPQDWAAYNAAQVNERRHFHDFLDDLCRTLPEPARNEPNKGGRPPIPIHDAVFSAVLKVYSLTSARRFSGELEEAHVGGYISRLPHFNSVLNVFDKPEITPVLRGMIEMSALPLTAVETKFAVDSTGFATTKYRSWYDEKYGSPKREAKWVKAHFTTGVMTNTVTAVNIDHQDAGDSPQFPELIHATAKGFQIGEVSADKAYAATPNFEAVEMHGGTFFPAFKNNTTGKVGGAFEKAFHYFCLRKEEYLSHYHKRSNIESTVSMLKRKFGDSVRAKNETSMRNEVYAKFIAHNLCVLVAEMYAIGIEPAFVGLSGCTNSGQAAQILRFPTS